MCNHNTACDCFFVFRESCKGVKPDQENMPQIFKKQYRQYSNSIIGAATRSHSDIFTNHMVAMEMTGIFGCGVYCCGACFYVPWLMIVGLYFFSVTSNGKLSFHILSCVDRHLAVVHPITYLDLRKGVGSASGVFGCSLRDHLS